MSTSPYKVMRISDWIAAVSVGLIAGLLFAFAVSVVPGFTHLTDTNYVSAFQQINLAIVNPVFMLVFAAAPIALIVSTILRRHDRTSKSFRLFALATIIYIVGTFGITAAGNIPLNNNLAKVELSTATTQQIAKARDDFEVPWNVLHILRTIASVAAFGIAVEAIRRASESTSGQEVR